MRLLDPGLVLGRAAALALAVALAVPASGQVIFHDDFESGDTHAWWPCQPLSFAVQFDSPGLPRPFDGDPEHDIFNDIKDGTLRPSVVGTFRIDPDPTPSETSLTCLVDSQPRNCNGLNYSVSSSYEGGHVVAIYTEACGIVTFRNQLGYFVDNEPPKVVAGYPFVTVDAANASAQVQLGFQDAITNVESVDCILDLNEQGTNPEIDPNAAFVSCNSLDPGFSFQPMRPPVGASRPRLFFASLYLPQLAAGNHVLWVRARDFWGHTATSFVSFRMDEAAAGYRGHVVAIGHDFPDTSIDSVDPVANTALLTPATGFTRNVRVLGLDLGLADAEGSTKSVVLDVIGHRNMVQLDRGIDYVEWSGDSSQDDEGVGAHLLGRDVLLIYDQNDPVRSAEIGAKLGWLSALRDFVNAGGVVVVLDGLIDGTPSETVRILGNAEPWNQPDAPPTASPLDVDVNLLDSGVRSVLDPFTPIGLVCRSDDPLALDVGDGPEPRSYQSADPSIAFIQDPAANEVFCVPRPLARDCDPVVLDRIYPLRLGTGPVRIRASGVGGDPETVFSRGKSDYAIFAAPNSAVPEAFCRLTANGFAAHDVSAGGSVTVASTNGSPDADGIYGGSLDLESVLGVELWETIDVGRTTNPPQAIQAPVEVEIPRYPTLFDSGSASYYVSNGCASATTGPTSPGTNPIVHLPPPTDECLWSGVQMSLMVEARDVGTGDVLAYATIPNQPFELGGFSTTCHGASFFLGWCVDVGDWPIVSHSPDTPWAVPQSPRLTLEYTGAPFAPAADLEAVQVLPRDGTSGIGLEEGLGLDPATEQYFAPKIPNQFADVLGLDELVYTGLPGGSGFSLTFDTTQLELAVTGLPQTLIDIPRSQLLPRILDTQTIGVDRPWVKWIVSGEGSPAGVQGALGVVDYGASASCLDPRCEADCVDYAWHGSWSFVFPASTPGGVGVQMPGLPFELACWGPTVAVSPPSLAFVQIDTAAAHPTADEFRRSAASFFDTYFDPLRTRVRDVGDELRMTAACSQASFCSPVESPDSPSSANRKFLGCYTPAAIAELLCP